MTIAERSMQITGLFEAELLTALLLWRWNHPWKDDTEFQNDLLERAAKALELAVDGQSLIENLPADETSLIAAIYYAEWESLRSGGEEVDGKRQEWLDDFKSSIPSCFHPQSDLLE